MAGRSARGHERPGSWVTGLLGLGLLLSPLTAWGAPITVSATGFVTDFAGLGGLTLPSVPVGSAFSATFRIDGDPVFEPNFNPDSGFFVVPDGSY